LGGRIGVTLLLFYYPTRQFFPEWGDELTTKRKMICPPFFLFQKEEKEIF